MKRIVVAGGGASGMMAAIAAAGGGCEVTLLERNEKLGKKIYITGKGRCNLTNDCEIEDFLDNVFENRSFAYSSIYALDQHALLGMLSEGGLETKTERGNRVFPVSDHASDVTKALTRLLEQRGVNVVLNTRVRSILSQDGRVTGVTDYDGRTWEAEAVILACGGRSYPATGSDGSGYMLASEAGHRITDTCPGLCGMVTAQSWPADLAGLSLRNVSVTLWQRGRKVRTEFGEMLFTHKGVSGPVILTLSCLYDVKQEAYLTLDLKPALDEGKLDKRILRDFSEMHLKDFGNSLGKLFPASLASKVALLSGIPLDKKVSHISAQERKNLVDTIKNLRLDIKEPGGFSEAIITRGGVDVREVDPSTLSSRKLSGLYIAGEMLALHGFTGGFNLQLAFSTGYLAGISAAD
ncbi:MAG: NAD(P)/FAD-dependent oxidoreductase [Eubacteriaceae bacterium]|nr:NAD(P)/FAD-dependent oxidoreductase [Eubacteriaceae bacterium]